jgi:type I restriction enzyme S subunit
MEDLGNIRLVWPSDTGDQNHLALRVTEIQEAHQKLATTLERQNELLVRRRQALITAAVTGQFDVFTASGRGVEE